MAKPKPVKTRNYVALAAIQRNGGKMDNRPKSQRTRQTQRQAWLRDQD